MIINAILHGYGDDDDDGAVVVVDSNQAVDNS
jgi:hypothetical protein